MDDSKLIEFVRHHPCLFDAKNKHYKDLNFRDNVWGEIAEALNQPVEECKSRWKNVRDTFMRRKRNKKMPTGSVSSRKPRKWLLEESLEFLHQVENGKAIVTNIIVKEESVDLDTDEEAGSQIEEPEIEKLNNNNNENTATSQPIEQQLNKVTEREEDNNKRQQDEETNSRKKQLVTDKISEMMARNLKERQELLSKAFGSEAEDEHPIDVFFKSFAASVKKMSPERQIRAKMQVCQIVGQLELEELRSRSSSTFVQEAFLCTDPFRDGMLKHTSD